MLAQADAAAAALERDGRSVLHSEDAAEAADTRLDVAVRAMVEAHR